MEVAGWVGGKGFVWDVARAVGTGDRMRYSIKLNGWNRINDSAVWIEKTGKDNLMLVVVQQVRADWNKGV